MMCCNTILCGIAVQTHMPYGPVAIQLFYVIITQNPLCRGCTTLHVYIQSDRNAFTCGVLSQTSACVIIARVKPPWSRTKINKLYSKLTCILEQQLYRQALTCFMHSVSGCLHLDQKSHALYFSHIVVALMRLRESSIVLQT